MAISPRTTRFTLLLGALAALPPLATDMALPASPAIATALHSTDGMTAFTLSVFLLGFAFGPLILGPMSDRFGRRPMLIFGLLLYSLAAVACTFSTSMPALLVFRLLQGIGAGAGASLPMAIVRDLFQGVEARVRFSYVTLVLGLAPVVAPIFGAFVLPLGGWRAIYGTLAITGFMLLAVTWFGYAESAPLRAGQRTSIGQVLRNYRTALSHRVCLGACLVNGLTFACMFSFISGSPLLFLGGLGISESAFSMVFACAACGTITGALINGKLTKRHWSSHHLLRTGLLLGSAATLTLVGLTLTGHISVATALPCIVISNMGYGFVGANASHEALAPLPQMAGAVAALLRSIQMLLGALASALVGLLFDGHSALAMASVMAASILCALFVHLFVLRDTAETPVSA